MNDIHVAGLRCALRENGQERLLLAADSLHLPAGSSLGVSGPSGGGKTTLLHTLAGLLPPTAGTVRWGGQDIYALPEALRAATAGMIFQDFLLIPGMSVLQNVLLPQTFRTFYVPEAARRRALDLLRLLGLTAQHRPVERLSRGEMQRVALARAFQGPCGILFADEPTASLDAANAAQVTDLLCGLCRERKATLVCISHDVRLLRRMDQRLWLEYGQLREVA